MKHKLISPLIIGLLITSLVHSQKLKVKFGEFSRDEIKMSRYEKDTTAKAVVLFDIGKTSFIDTDKGLEIKFTRHKRIKIFDKSASNYAEITIPYYVDGYGKTEIIKNIKAVTFTIENNRLVETKLDPSNIYDEQINERWYQKKFVFPNVQEGSVFEYTYELKTPFFFNIPDWTFQDRIPTIYSEYEARMVPFYDYVFIAQGIKKFDYQNSKISNSERTYARVEFKDYIHTYVLKDVPAFKDESYITSVNDYIMKMDFQMAKIKYPTGGTKDIMSTWTGLNEALIKHKNFGKYLKSASRYAKKIIEEELSLNDLNPTEKAQKIIEYVKNNFIWNGFHGKYARKSVKEFVNKHEGNVAEINLFLIAMLNEAGIEAKPIILSTRSHGKIPIEYPFDHITNYVIAFVNISPAFLTDATKDHLPYNMLPVKCLNEKGIIVDEEEEVKWVNLSSQLESLERINIQHITNPSTLNTDVIIAMQSTNYDAYQNRDLFENNTTKIKNHYTSKVGEISNVKTLNFDNERYPYAINFKGSYQSEQIVNKIVIKPFLNFPKRKNNLTQEERSYPVDFEYIKDRQFSATITIPKNYIINNLPENYKVDDELVSINLSYTNNENTVFVVGNYKFKKAVYVPEEYTRVKSYLNTIVNKFNQYVVLEKTQELTSK
ncbi:transglutaminase domain-containing protein [Wenyingzhuangia marina]|uniref:Transglutaminase-like superfamily protein n=1 Tax=Wenyingzhuangia marina TaxID=1195760 RepID=A0A1M5U3G1_9FLAO|nr:DUF3857 domain-containing protein [Wenyingzhuangia marina]GGF69822.1 hypothetical protein GCM10011397_10920 [Wenyingzhuangia marina]SHH57401.1 Transglutaminase-like superfamily protein [Wenyingzhuangia marina]